MQSSRLFLGLPIQAHDYQQIDPNFLKLFIDNQSDYLHEINYREQRYLGKFVDSITDLTALELLESNIHSLLTKLIPLYSKKQLILFPLIK